MNMQVHGVKNSFSTNENFMDIYQLERVKDVMFNCLWRNGGWYNEKKAPFPKLEVGELAKTHDENDDRKIIFVGTPIGTVAVYERYTAGDNGVFLSQWPEDFKMPYFLKAISSHSSLSASSVTTLLGDEAECVPNIGKVLNGLFLHKVKLDVKNADVLLAEAALNQAGLDEKDYVIKAV